jgi:hypothetical protein
MKKLLPRYPIYIPSKGGADNCLTAKVLLRDKVPFFLVVEPQEVEAYQRNFPAENFAKEFWPKKFRP